MARLRAQVERGEAIRQNLEYELTLAKKATNQVKRIAVEKEAETSGNVALLKGEKMEFIWVVRLQRHKQTDGLAN